MISCPRVENWEDPSMDQCQSRGNSWRKCTAIGPYRSSLKTRHQGIGPYGLPLKFIWTKWLPNLAETSGLHQHWSIDCSLSGPVLRDTARLSQWYPPIARYGVFGVSTWPSGCDTPSPFSEPFPLGEHAKWRCDTPPEKGYLSDPCAIPYENKANGCDTPLCDTISKGYCAIWGGISHWAAKIALLWRTNSGSTSSDGPLFRRGCLTLDSPQSEVSAKNLSPAKAWAKKLAKSWAKFSGHFRALFIECFRGRHRGGGGNFTSFLQFSGPFVHAAKWAFSASELPPSWREPPQAPLDLYLLCRMTHQTLSPTKFLRTYHSASSPRISLSFRSLAFWNSLVNFKQGISLVICVFSLLFPRFQWVWQGAKILGKFEGFSLVNRKIKERKDRAFKVIILRDNLTRLKQPSNQK